MKKRKLGLLHFFLVAFLSLACVATVFATEHPAGRQFNDEPELNLQRWMKHIQATSDQVPHTDSGKNLWTAQKSFTLIDDGDHNAPDVEDVRQPTKTTGLAAASGEKKRRKSKVIHVEKDGSGDFTTIQAAIDSLPHKTKSRVEIKIGPGIFREKVNISRTKRPITLQGESYKRTVMAWNDTAATIDKHGKPLNTLHSATVTINSDLFIAKNITFMNYAPAQKPGAVERQAVALRISGDRAAFYSCRFYGHQDTLYDHKGRHYFKNCYITGTVDFVFGNGRSLYEEVELYAESDSGVPGVITAQRRIKPTPDTGFSFVRCKITGTNTVYLGRAWGDDSRVVFASTFMDKIIVPQGWGDWGIPARQKTAYYAQYNCTGPGAEIEGRVKWARNLSEQEAKPFLTIGFINGRSWLEGYDHRRSQ